MTSPQFQQAQRGERERLIKRQTPPVGYRQGAEVQLEVLPLLMRGLAIALEHVKGHVPMGGFFFSEQSNME
jgi:hypothetical protein